jgi:hypothetical protein
MAVPIITYVLLYAAFLAFAPPDVTAGIASEQLEGWNRNVVTVAGGSYWEIISNYNRNYVVGRYMGLIFQMRLPKILAMFLLGMYAYRIGVFPESEGTPYLIKKVLVYGAVLGLIGNCRDGRARRKRSSVPSFPDGAGRRDRIFFGVPALALFIIAVIATLWQSEGWRNVLAFSSSGRTDGSDKLSLADCDLRDDLLRLRIWNVRDSRSVESNSHRSDDLRGAGNSELDLAAIFYLRTDGMDLAAASHMAAA